MSLKWSANLSGPPPPAAFLSDVLVSWLPFLVVFATVPLAIFVPNLIEFNYDLSVLAPFLAAALVSLIAVSGLWVVKPQWRRNFSSGLFYLGVFLVLSDILAPLRWNVLDDANIPEPWKQTFLEFFLMLVLVLCWDRFPKTLVKAFGVPLVLVLLGSHLFELFLAWQESSDYEARNVRSTTAPYQSSESLFRTRPGNVYHFVFDAYSGLRFMETVLQTDLVEAFAGFTFFQNTLSNYESSHTSAPSFLIGRIYSQGSLRAWQEEAKHGGLRRQLQDAGYEVSVYVPERTRPWMYNGATHVRTSHDLSHSTFRGAAVLRLAQMAIVRLAPSNVRRETYEFTNHLFANLVGWNLSVPIVRQFLDEESERSDRGNYVYVHVLLPHEPYVWDGTCTYTGDTDFKEQTLCATKLMEEILQALRTLGRFHDALIIFQSDHGLASSESGESDLLPPLPQDIRDKVQSMVSPVYDADGFLRRINPLLLVKPPLAESHDLRVSRVPAQLLDVPATVYQLLDIEQPETDGKSVFELQESEPREIHLFPGTFTLTSRAKGSVLGESSSDTSLAHISYTQGQGWRAYPDVPVDFE